MTAIFSRRHYEAIAAALVKARTGELPEHEIADLFAADNPLFNRDKFFKACGVMA